jgi:hypothetical protein
MYDFTSEGQCPPAPTVVPTPPQPSPAARAVPDAVADDAGEDVGATAWRPSGGQATHDLVFGWRVQVFAGSSRETAMAVARELRDACSAAVHVDYLEPHYKVRLGDCPSRNDCLSLQADVRKQGWTSAWIVRSAIQP